MATARCDNHKSRKEPKFVFVAEPVGYPNPEITCRAKGCSKAARVWLNAIDAILYRRSGQRRFTLPFHPAKTVTLGDGGRYESEQKAAPEQKGE
jgi:hypothetical protein